MKNVKSTEVILMRSRILTVLFSMLISALLLLPLISSAKGDEKIESNSKVYIQPLSIAQHAVITIAGVENKKYTMSIESDNGGKIYYSKVVNSPEQFSKVFNFSNLEDGSYMLKIKSNDEEKDLNFAIFDGKVKVFYNERENAEYSVLGEKAIFSVPNTNNLKYSFLVLDEQGNELYSAYESKKEIKKVFDFSTVAPGNYQIVASTAQTSFSYGYEKKK